MAERARSSGKGAVWLVEDGIGEVRAALVRDGEILEAEIETPGLRAGSVAAARLARIVAPGRVGLVEIEGGGEALLQPLPPMLTEGGAVRVEVTREAVGRKRPVCRAARDSAALGPDLHARLAATGKPVRTVDAHGVDPLEEAGWSELLEEAAECAIAFPGGGLLMSLTPAMTLFDVDGTLPPDALAIAGAGAAGRAIRRLSVAGSIGIDLPTAPDKAVRAAAAAALDATLPPPFERTAVNGFGFLQIVRPQARASLPQAIAADPAGAAARALLRRAERTGGAGPRTLTAHPSVIARLEAEHDWLAALRVRLGAEVVLRAAPGLLISGGHVDALHP